MGSNMNKIATKGLTHRVRIWENTKAKDPLGIK